MLGLGREREKEWAAFEAEALPLMPDVFRVAQWLVRDREIAEDLTQETFVQALKSFHRYSPDTNCRAWLCKIMFYKRSQWIRANSRFCQFDETESQFPSVNYATMLPPDFMGKKMSLSLFALPDKFRQIVWLAVVEEFTYREIAQQLEIPIGTVMSRLHRGRELLRMALSSSGSRSAAARETR